jgi:hypothetical protein
MHSSAAATAFLEAVRYTLAESRLDLIPASNIVAL